jgi:hypothetical protein
MEAPRPRLPAVPTVASAEMREVDRIMEGDLRSLGVGESI